LARGFRAPSLKELYLNFVDINHDIHGNENLKAETSINTNVFLQYNSKLGSAYTWGLELNIFNNNIKDNIKLLPVLGDNPNTNPYSYINVHSFISQGVEFSFNNKIYPWLTIKFGYALTGEKVELSETITSDFEYYSDFNASVNYWFRKADLNFSLYYKYNGVSPMLYIVDGDNVEYGYMNSYNTLDINVSRWFWKRRVNVQVGGKNLFNNTDIDISEGNNTGVHGGGPESVNWGRTFFIRLQFKFNK